MADDFEACGFGQNEDESSRSDAGEDGNGAKFVGGNDEGLDCKNEAGPTPKPRARARPRGVRTKVRML